MNQGIYQLVFSRVLNMLVPVSEATRNRSGKTNRRDRKTNKSLLAFTLLISFVQTNYVMAETVLPAGISIKTIDTSKIGITSSDANNINFKQIANTAVIDYNRLNLGKGQNFNVDMLRGQSLLNRIHDLSPSILNGNVNAKGNLYFINTNGIIFGANAQFNVGSIYAGTLDITDELFNGGFINSDNTFKPVFNAVAEIVTANPASKPASLVIEAGAQINAAKGGKVVLFSEDIKNSGIINTPDGQTILAAGKTVYLAGSKDPAGFMVEVNGGGNVTNTNLGEIIAERGNITMMGLAVNQEGTVRATTSVRAKGSIFLLAQDKVVDANGLTIGNRDGIVTLAKNSLTEVTPALIDKEEISRQQAFEYFVKNDSGSLVIESGTGTLKKSEIKIEASLVNIDGVVSAKSGSVIVSTLKNASTKLASPIKQRIYLGENAKIDVSGADASAPMSRNQIDPELFSDQNKDNPILRDSGLSKAQVYIDLRTGTELIDTVPFEKLKTVTLAEALTDAGKITLSTTEDLIVRKGAVINVSGGSTTYEAGTIKETNLYYNGTLVPISEAKKGVPYDKIVDVYANVDEKTGFAETWAIGGSDSTGWGNISRDLSKTTLKTLVVGTQVNSYYEGGDAGTFSTVLGDSGTKNVVFEGEILAFTKPGLQQLINNNLPAGGRYIVSAANLEVASIAKGLINNFNFNQKLEDDFKSVISDDFLDNGFYRIGLGGKNLIINTELNIKAGKEFFDGFTKTNYSSELTLAGNLQINANIIAPNTNFTAVNTTIANGVTISTAGTFTNDRPGIAGQYTATPAINGGRFKAENLIVGKNVLVDTSAGAHVTSAGLVEQGASGSIGFISNSKLDDSVMLKSYGFDKGGTLAINYFGQNLNISGNPNSSATDIDISNNFFSAGGFSSFNLSGLNVSIGDNTNPAQEIYAAAKTWQLKAGFANQGGAPTLASVASIGIQPESTRKPVSFNFTANITPDRQGGVLTLAENATIRTDRGGIVSLAAGKQVNVLGDVTTPSGTINIRLNDGDLTVAEDPTQSVFIGEKSTLSAMGSAFTLPDSQADLLKTQVFNAGTININQAPSETEQKGAVIIKQGALLNVSGAAITNDVKTVAGFKRTTLHGDAGTINLTGIGSLLIDGDLKGAATGTGRGGTLNLSLAPQEFNLTNAFPNDSGSFIITQQKQLQASNLTTGSPIKPTLADDDISSQADTALLKAQISAQQIAEGGFANLSVKSFRGEITKPSSAIELADGVDLKIAGSLKLETPVIKVKDNGSAQLKANHITLKSPVANLADISFLNDGTGKLSMQATQTYIDGVTIIAGVDKTTINNVLDIHGRGNLTANGTIDLTARQIFPNTAALDISRPDELKFEAIGVDNKIIINNSGESAKPILSAGGGLVFKADNIVQNGNLTAPFGTIKLDGKDSVVLTAASKTSISANSLTIPLLKTQKGGSKLDPLDTILAEKRIDIVSKKVDLQKNAVLDLSSTGSLFAYEFISGLGGTNDVLNQANTYAVIPNIGSDFAPVDITYNNTLQPVGAGASIFLTGVPGLATGTYTLLPARYALVPGAFMLQAKQSADLLPGLTAPQFDGTTLTSGYFANAGTLARDANWSTFKVTDGAIFRPIAGTISKAPSQYLLTNLNDFYSNPLNTNGKKVGLPVDAGKLSLDATNLKLDATVIANKGKNGIGLQVEIASDNIRVVSNNDATDTTSLQLTANNINNLNAESVLLGGTIERDIDGINQIKTTANNVVMENNSNNVIKTPTFIATAKDSVTVKAGAAINTGLAAKTPIQLKLGTKDAGALLALSSASDILYSRVGGANAAQGSLTIESDSTLKAGNSVVLDATKLANLDSNVALQDNGSATLGANRILIGNAPADTVGLNVNAASLAALGQLKSLTLNSYGNVDTFGAASLGNNQLDLTIDAAGIVGNLALGETADIAAASTQPITITAKNFTLKNTLGAEPLAPIEASNRNLVINANSVRLEGKLDSNTNSNAGKTTVAGYNQLTINTDNIRVANTGDTTFNVANTQLNTGVITGETGADYKITGQNFSLARLANAKPVEKVGFGANLTIEADNLTVASDINLASGKLALTSKLGDLNIDNGATLNAASSSVVFDIARVHANAGSVTLKSDSGNININTGALVEVTSLGNANAGVVQVLAKNGSINLNGQLKGGSTGTGKGGQLQINAKTLANSSAIVELANTDKQAIGFTEGRDYRLRQGDINIAGKGENALTAREITVSADGGKITVSGDLIATAPKNSKINLNAKNGVTLESTAVLMANSTKAGEEGGRVNITATSSTPDITNTSLKAGSLIDVSGGQNGVGGEVNITAPRTSDNKDIEIAEIDTTFKGVKKAVNLIGEKTVEKIGANYILSATDVSKTAATGFYKQAEIFMKSVLTDPDRGLARLGLNNNPLFSISPEIEVVNKNGGITIPVAGLSLHDWRFDAKTGEGVTDVLELEKGFNANGVLIAGTLSLRAAKDINVKGTLSDGFGSTSLTEVAGSSTPAVTGKDAVIDENTGEELEPAIPASDAIAATGVQGINSWSYNIVAGADFSAANQLMTNETLFGNVVIDNNKGIRTGTGDINIAGAGDLRMGGAGSVIYTAGRRASPLTGFVEPDKLNPLYLTDGGNININTKGNIVGGESISTPRQLINNWLFRQGSANKDTTWWVRPDKFQQGTATLGGGNVTVNAGKDISNFSVSAATTARFDTSGNTANQTINQTNDGGGDVLVNAGNDITNGVYFVAKGEGEINAGGSINKTENTFGTVLALQDGTIKVNANKSAYIETVVNPTLLAQSKTNDASIDNKSTSSFYNSYSDRAEVTVSSLLENATFGQTPIDSVSTRISDFKPANANADQSLRYYPSKVNAVAFNGDVTFGSEAEGLPAVLLPSATGGLKLLAANNVQILGVLISDADLANVGSIKNPLDQTNVKLFDDALKNHAPQLLHKNNVDPVLVVANAGDITSAENLTITLPKFARFVAGNNIGALQINVQNNNPSDISLIKAGNDVKTQNVNISGPGELLVQATRNVDLRSTAASTISAIGNTDNPALPSNGASITLQAGLGKGANVQGYIDQYILPTGAGPAVLKNKMDELDTYKLVTEKSLTAYMRNTQKPSETPYTDASALAAFNASSLENKTIFANRHVSTELVASALGFAKARNHDRGDSALATLFPTKNLGNVLLPDSKISTNSGGSIDVIAPGGEIIVGAPGVTSAGSGAEIGVITEKGGSIRMIADKNIEVNQSKVITQFGSDIVMWSNTGTIDAGKGAKSATSTPQRIVQTDAFGNTFVEVRGVATGSGIRAQSYDPDGLNGPELEPKKGNVYLVAPVVDAGEAGIEAGDLVIVAPIVLNAANIQVQGASSGVPIAATAGLSGVSAGLSPDAVNSATSAVAQSVSQAGNQQAFVKPVLPSIVNVEVISIGN